MHRRRVVRMFVLLVALTLLSAACGDDGGGGDADAPNEDGSTTTPTSEATTTTAPIPEGGVAVTGLSLTQVAFGDGGSVTITNDSDAEINVDGLWVCNRPSYTPLSGTIAAGATIQVDAGELGGLSEEGGEAALYSSNDFGSSDDIVDYVQWGTGGGREGVAVDAGLWPDGGSVEPEPGFGSIEKFDVAGGPDGWE